MNCETRTPPDCHIKCERYKAFREEKDKEIEAKTKVRDATPSIPRAVVRQIYKEMKGK